MKKKEMKTLRIPQAGQMGGETHVCLREDVRMVIVETDEENPKTIATIDWSDEPIKTTNGYRVRMKFAAASAAAKSEERERQVAELIKMLEEER